MEVPESVRSVEEVLSLVKDVAEPSGKAVVFAAVTDNRLARAVVVPGQMPLAEEPADTVVEQGLIPVKCVAAPEGNPVVSVMAKVLYQMIVSFVMAERHVLPVEEQEAIGIIKEKRKGTYGLHLLTAVRYAIMVKNYTMEHYY